MDADLVSLSLMGRSFSIPVDSGSGCGDVVVWSAARGMEWMKPCLVPRVLGVILLCVELVLCNLRWLPSSQCRADLEVEIDRRSIP